MKQARSVKPRMKYRAMLPTVLNQQSIDIDDVDGLD